MNHRISSVALLLFMALSPIEGRTAAIDVSDVDLFAFASFKTQTDSSSNIAPLGSPTRAEALVRVEGTRDIPFPNVPTSQTKPFASSAADANGFFGVGVNGFFFGGSLPPNALLASGTTTQSIKNNSAFTFPVAVDFFIPAPTIRFFGVGNSFPPGEDPTRDAMASAVITLQTTLTHPDGSKVEAIPLDYGLRVSREPVSGVIFPFPTRDGAGSLSRFDDPDGSFGFKLSDLGAKHFSLGEIGPGDTLEFTYDYVAQASTGFGETGVFAAIGDPFNLSTGDGRFEISTIPEPGTFAIFVLGLFVLSIFAHERQKGVTS
jgi:hypothetical protein